MANDILNDTDLDGLSEDTKAELVNSRIAGLTAGLAGVLLDSATNQFSVDVPVEQRDARAALLAKQEQALRSTISALREIRSTIKTD